MIHGVSVPVEISFGDISSSAKEISLLKTNFQSGKINSAFELRDIELLGETSYDSQYNGKDIEGEKLVSGFKFELVHISKTGQEVNCKFLVTSTDRDRQLSLNNSIFLYDDKGFESQLSSVTIGSKTGRYARYNMIHNVAVPVNLKFTTVNSSAENIALLKVPFTSGNTSSEYQERNIPFEIQNYNLTSKGVLKNSNKPTSSTRCSEIYIYRMKGVALCVENLQLPNHNEKILSLEAGTRYKTTVCEEREISLKGTTGPQELLAGLKNANIALGNNYYFKVSCVLGTTVISQQEDTKAQLELNKKGKYKRQLQTFKLNAW